MDNLETSALLVGLDNLFNRKNYFDICFADNLCKLAGVRMPERAEAIFRVMHCVDYSVMPKGMKDNLAVLFVEVLKEGVPELEFTLKRPTSSTNADAPRQGVFRRMLGKGP